MQVNGDLHIGEGNRWATQACSRLTGNGMLHLLTGLAVGVVPALIGMSVASFVSDFFEAGWLYLPVLAVTVLPLLLLAIRILSARRVARFRRNLILRGVSNPLPSSFSATPEGLVTLLGEVETRAPWTAVSEIFPVGPYWVLLVQGSANFLPKRNFSDPAQERAFITEVLQRLPPEARERSSDAARFAVA